MSYLGTLSPLSQILSFVCQSVLQLFRLETFALEWKRWLSTNLDSINVGGKEASRGWGRNAAHLTPKSDRLWNDDGGAIAWNSA